MIAVNKAQKAEYDARYYVAHKEERKARSALWMEENRERRAAWSRIYYIEHAAPQQRYHTHWMTTIKEVQGCADCGTHEGTLHHHHLDSSTKRYDLAVMANCSVETILDEIAKCTVLCLPCHRKRHATMRGG